MKSAPTRGSITVIHLAFDAQRRHQALALFATVIAGAAVIGPLLGGVLVSADIAGSSWRAIFLVNVPVGLALLIFGRAFLPRTRLDRFSTAAWLCAALALAAAILTAALSRAERRPALPTA